jgi:hypothetical protein
VVLLKITGSQKFRFIIDSDYAHVVSLRAFDPPERGKVNLQSLFCGSRSRGLADSIPSATAKQRLRRLIPTTCKWACLIHIWIPESEYTPKPWPEVVYEPAHGWEATRKERIVPCDGAVVESVRDTPATIDLDAEIANISIRPAPGPIVGKAVRGRDTRSGGTPRCLTATRYRRFMKIAVSMWA